MISVVKALNGVRILSLIDKKILILCVHFILFLIKKFIGEGGNAKKIIFTL